MNIKKAIACIAALCIAGTAFPMNTVKIMDSAIEASAADYTEGVYENLAYRRYSEYVVITGCNSKATEVVIPDEIEELPVTSIGISAFKYCSSLAEITISDSVTSIGDNAFSICEGLESITILNPDCEIYDNSETISNGYDNDGKCYFNGTIHGYSGSTAQAYAEKYGYNFKAIGEAPETEENLKYKKYSDHVEITGSDKSATKIVIPAEVDGLPITSINNYAFQGCSSLTSITIPDSVTSIGGHAFEDCSSLTSVTIPDSVTSIGEHAFDDCSSLESITIPDGVTSIRERTFSGCTHLTSITIPNSVTSIGDYAFDDCFVLAKITIPDSVASIGIYAFDDCSSIAKITIPDGVTSIGNRTFSGCSSLTEITILNPDCEIYDNSETISNGYDNDRKRYFDGTAGISAVDALRIQQYDAGIIESF